MVHRSDAPMADDASGSLRAEVEGRRAVGLAEQVRQACLVAAMAAYEDAGLQGLCAEGRWECALDALRSVDLQPIVAAAKEAGDGGASR